MATELTEEDQQRIAERYPKPGLKERLFGIAAGIALALGIALVVIGGIEQSNPPVVGMVRAFEVVSPQLTKVEVVVQRTDPSQPASCFIYVQAVSYERVGELEFEVPPDDETLSVVYVDIKTVKEATAVTVENCELD